MMATRLRPGAIAGSGASHFASRRPSGFDGFDALPSTKVAIEEVAAADEFR
jgi:hypothetical protein